jgi:hypothetical protein
MGLNSQGAFTISRHRGSLTDEFAFILNLMISLDSQEHFNKSTPRGSLTERNLSHIAS